MRTNYKLFKYILVPAGMLYALCLPAQDTASDTGTCPTACDKCLCPASSAAAGGSGAASSASVTSSASAKSKQAAKPVSTKAVRSTSAKQDGKKPIVVIIKSKKKEVKKEPEPKPEPVPAPPPEPEDKRFFMNPAGTLSLSIALDLNKQKTIGDYNSGAGNASLSSKWGFGMMLGAEYMFTQKFSMYGKYYMDGVDFYDPEPLTIPFTVYQDPKIASKFELGAKYRFNKFVYMAARLGMKQDYIFYATSATTGNLDNYWHGLFGLGCGYHILERGIFTIDGETGFDLYFPRSLSYGDTSTGYSINTEVRLGLNYRHTIFSFFRGEFFQLRSSVFTGQYGYALLFGVGFTGNMHLKK